MKIEILGSGGAVSTPKPFCDCEVCRLARKGTMVDSRYGPSVFIHGPDILIDTPEEIFIQINRSTIKSIKACFYSHWHPDHTSGKRIFEMNKDWMGLPPKNKQTNVFLPKKIDETFSTYLGLKGHFDHFVHSEIINMNVIENDEKIIINDYHVNPVQLQQDYSFGYEIIGNGKKILVIMDELKFWIPNDKILNTKYDCIYLPIGIVDVNPITNFRSIIKNHPILDCEQTLLETIEYVNKLSSNIFILSHIEEPDNISYEMGCKIGEYCSNVTGKNVKVAYDTQIIEI